MLAGGVSVRIQHMVWSHERQLQIVKLYQITNKSNLYDRIPRNSFAIFRFYQLGLTIIGVQRQNTHTTHVFPADDKKESHKLYSDCKGIV